MVRLVIVERERRRCSVQQQSPSDLEEIRWVFSFCFIVHLRKGALEKKSLQARTLKSAPVFVLTKR